MKNKYEVYVPFTGVTGCVCESKIIANQIAYALNVTYGNGKDTFLVREILKKGK